MKFKTGKRDFDEHRFQQEDAEKLLYVQQPFSVREAYRSARTNLMFLQRQEGSRCQKFVLTSANAGEGKSMNCANLAIAMAENGKRVILIDCDMRKPTQHRLLQSSQEHGLSEYLAGVEETLNVHPVASVENLHFVTSGFIPPNPTELLSSPTMGRLLSTLEQQYDYVLLDSPPINVVADALVLSSWVSGYILVVRADRTTRNDVEQALSRLEQVDATVYGFLLNSVNPKGGGGGRYGRYGKYGKYGYSRYGYGYGESEPERAGTEP